MDVVRFWKDPEYRSSLSADQTRALPEHPCGPVELTDEALVGVLGASTEQNNTAGCCGGTSTNTNCAGRDTCCRMTQACYTCSGAACK
ncbi:mersacidin/lichenicidin family type 2 lantibiotic [Streptomyces sp. NPDC021096]|uniref:mersacidin/lichenicidin family type 2 lantibiotic n=1 Tax=Streptomyces sp. NPDC021096 TaxID=3154792 RepID=UPI003403DE0E